ncbi:hypothetical protein H8S11_02025 [Flintibacter sp. NSJ-23]|uniref:Uncharacterized protein n=1 Tax=Flintibacter hominis TaxID=2763048 RepID=A0A8J6J731_9FIRM|nr:hypothetical protein [Flintibacter hominis]MBC5721602.1 hypothetical protein [Flintibacter hominis]
MTTQLIPLILLGGEASQLIGATVPAGLPGRNSARPTGISCFSRFTGARAKTCPLLRGWFWDVWAAEI